MITIQIFVNESFSLAVIDTGATVPTISHRLFHVLNLKKLPNSEGCLQWFNETFIFTGRVALSLTIGSLTKDCELYIVEKTKIDIIIGLDLKNLFGSSVDEQNRVFQHLDEDNIYEIQRFQLYYCR